jgi:hypothetical protein
MISLLEAYARLSSLHPAFARTDSCLVEEWLPETPPPTHRLARLADLLATEGDSIPSEVKASLFDEIETLLLLGDDMTQTAIATGFLEALLNAVLRGALERKTVVSMLGDASLQYFNEWDQLSDNMAENPPPSLGVSHEQKAKDGIRILEKWLEKNPSALPKDREAAEYVLEDLHDSLRGK